MPSQVANNAQCVDFVERITAQGWNNSNTVPDDSLQTSARLLSVSPLRVGTFRNTVPDNDSQISADR